jgi:hypothetical protein
LESAAVYTQSLNTEAVHIDAKMPTITIYLDAELYDFVKESPSAIIQQALKEYMQKKEASNEQ